MSEKQLEHFDAVSVALEGSNLIEASAGTGKTYSIAVLVLRLIIEKGLSIREILMVTFTNAAVAELEERVRLFTRKALRAAEGLEISDSNIVALVEDASELIGAEIVRQRLQDAVLFLDEASIMTIHSFCQNTLNEFAFETQQLFGMELQANSDDLMEGELNHFWRRRITTLPVALLELLGGAAFRPWLFNRLKEHLSGKRYLSFEAQRQYVLDESEVGHWEESCAAFALQMEALSAARSARFEAEKGELSRRFTKAGDIKNFGQVFESVDTFYQALYIKSDKAYVQRGFPDWLEEVEKHKAVEQEREILQVEIRSLLTCYAIQECSQSLKQIMQRRNVMSYNDLIANLHKALLQRENPALVAALRQKYKAVFVDEFQDTDRQQYEIFDKAFSENTILFYIGDPKQSIYAFRKADVFTYLRARESVDHLYGMNRSFRSSRTLIDALNHFFLPYPEFDTFHFKGAQSRIDFQPVDSPEPNRKGVIWKDGVQDTPISIYTADNVGLRHEAVAAQVYELLCSGRYQLGTEDERRSIRPSDIGILVRRGATGKEVQSLLSQLGIPSVCVDETKVLQSEEAIAIYYLLEAIAGSSRSKINRVLRSSLTTFNASELLILEEEAVLDKFLRYRDVWQNQGVYAAIMAFIAEFGVRSQLLSGAVDGAQRRLTNIYQLSEILHSNQTRMDLSMTELISWLQRGIADKNIEGDEYEQRVESDEDAVIIVTIHKSKGLEYPIVLAPDLNLNTDLKRGADLFSFRDPNTSEYFFVDKSLATEEQKLWREEQEEQENRRLLYVALTRAVYKCFIYPLESKPGTTLPYFLAAFNPPAPGLIQIESEAAPKPGGRYSSKAEKTTSPLKVPTSAKLLQKNWGRMSFSSLKAERVTTTRLPYIGTDEGYEQFVMRDLQRGTKTGDMLHYILERVTFDNDANWDGVLEGALHRFAPSKQDAWKPMLQTMLEHVFSARIVVADRELSLSQVDWNRRIPEFGFDFPVSAFKSEELGNLSDPLIPIKLKYGTGGVLHEGIMNGMIDLFFEHDGRFYILDWKSNYLGPTPDFYSRDRIKEAMDEEGYHLQYLIYCVAARKYLEQRMKGFDYEKQFGGVIYLFLRGLRPGLDTGIYTDKPSLTLMNALGKLFEGK